MWGASPDEDCTRDERAREEKTTFTGSVFGLLALLVADAALGQAGGSNAMEKGMEIRILIEGTALAATLEDNAASRDFVAQLPLDLTLEDYNATERSPTFRRACRRKEHRKASIRMWAMSLTSPLGGTWPSSIATSAIRGVSFGSAGSTAT